MLSTCYLRSPYWLQTDGSTRSSWSHRVHLLNEGIPLYSVSPALLPTHASQTEHSGRLGLSDIQTG